MGVTSSTSTTGLVSTEEVVACSKLDATVLLDGVLFAGALLAAAVFVAVPLAAGALAAVLFAVDDFAAVVFPSAVFAAVDFAGLLAGAVFALELFASSVFSAVLFAGAALAAVLFAGALLAAGAFAAGAFAVADLVAGALAAELFAAVLFVVREEVERGDAVVSSAGSSAAEGLVTRAPAAREDAVRPRRSAAARAMPAARAWAPARSRWARCSSAESRSPEKHMSTGRGLLDRSTDAGRVRGRRSCSGAGAEPAPGIRAPSPRPSPRFCVMAVVLPRMSSSRGPPGPFAPSRRCPVGMSGGGVGVQLVGRGPVGQRTA